MHIIRKQVFKTKIKGYIIDGRSWWKIPQKSSYLDIYARLQKEKLMEYTCLKNKYIVLIFFNIHIHKAWIGYECWNYSNSHCNWLLTFCLEYFIICLVLCLDIYGKKFYQHKYRKHAYIEHAYIWYIELEKLVSKNRRHRHWLANDFIL